MEEALPNQRDEALSRALELEAGVSSALEERRGLMERCVAAEAETERTRTMGVELRRKLDDANAALHELGRENQSIQVTETIVLFKITEGFFTIISRLNW